MKNVVFRAATAGVVAAGLLVSSGVSANAQVTSPAGSDGLTEAAATVPQPVGHSGYTIDFNEEFNGTTLDSTKWLDQYLPHFAKNQAATKAQYTIANGIFTERIAEGTPAWSPEYDGTVKVSSIQTYNANWWHRFKPDVPNVTNVPTFNGYTFKYGYVEMRAKLSNNGGGGHQALWLVGTEDKTSANANSEIDVVETAFNNSSTWRIYNHPWSDPNSTSGDATTAVGVDLSADFHTYGMDWSPTSLKFYLDGKLVNQLSDPPNAMMGIILGIYTDAGTGPANASWPKQWQVDYLRVYKKDAGYPNVYERIRDRQTGGYLHIESRTGYLQSSSIPATNWSSQWTEIPTADGYVRLKNRWTGEFMHTEQRTGKVQVGAVAAVQWSADWKLENVDGYKRFKNRETGQYLDVEARDGTAHYDPIPATAWSSQWRFDFVQN